jgi:hypothetical protein
MPLKTDTTPTTIVLITPQPCRNTPHSAINPHQNQEATDRTDGEEAAVADAQADPTPTAICLLKTIYPEI